MPRKSAKASFDLTRHIQGAAAIDIGSRMHMAAVSPEAAKDPIRSFDTFTSDPHALAEWFKACKVTSVAMEYTGVYWIPVYEILEQHGFDVILVNARYAKNVPGRKTGWMRAEAAGDPGPWRQQALLGRGRWDADALRDIVRNYVIEHLGTDDGVLVVDETGFLKKGQASCGVGRQYTGSAGKITNCQIGVFATYVSARGHAFIDRALYLPKDWTSDRERLQQAHVPDDVVFATKPALASMMIERSIEAGVPFRWVAADSVYGVGDVERTLRRAGVGYVLGVKGNHWFGSWATNPLIAGEAKDIAANLPEQDWYRLSAGHGTKGERLYDWAYLALADLDAEEFDCPIAGPWTRGLLIRRSIGDGDLAYFTTWCPKGTTMQELVNVEGTRWRIEECFETAKNEFGLDHNETRSWHGWHRHVSLVMLAYAVMASVRYQANSRKPKKTQRRTRSSSSAGPYRKSGASS